MGEVSQNRLWGGRFNEPPALDLLALSSSIHFDAVLAPYDIMQTIAHVNELHRCSYLNDSQHASVHGALATLLTEVQAGTWLPADDEDIHSAIERTIIERVGADIGGRMRAGRSRNDQVATDLRLYLLDMSKVVAGLVLDLIDSISAQAQTHADSLCPGFTHLQHAQPVTLGHELAKHIHRLHDDLARLRDWRTRTSVSPMGAGALAGSSLGLDPARIAEELGFTSVAENSIDAVSDRDFVAEFLFVTALLGTHLSRLGNEIVLWTSSEFGWAVLHDSWSTGSSLMPQKRNPDIAELARGKAGRLLGNLTSVMTMLHALPFGYNRDQQEDKEPVFDSTKTLLLVLPALNGLVRTLTFDVQRMSAAADIGYTTATDVAEWLVTQGVPFREAHEIAGACVRAAEAAERRLDQLTDAQLVEIDPRLTSAVRDVLPPIGALRARSSVNGPGRVREQLAAAAQQTEKMKLQWGAR